MDIRNPFHRIDPSGMSICSDGSVKYDDKELYEKSGGNVPAHVSSRSPNDACSNILACSESLNDGRCHNVGSCEESDNFNCANFTDCSPYAVNRVGCSDYSGCDDWSVCPKP